MTNKKLFLKAPYTEVKERRLNVEKVLLVPKSPNKID